MDIKLLLNAECTKDHGSFKGHLSAWNNNKALKVISIEGGSFGTSLHLMYIVGLTHGLQPITKPCSIEVILPNGLVRDTIADWVNGTGKPSANHINRALKGLRNTIAQKGVILRFVV